jgi:predicted nucleic acid-binding protein
VSAACYLDSSAILAFLYGEPGALPPGSLAPAVTSTLTRVECLRSIERHRWQGRLTDERMLRKREGLFQVLRSARVVAMEPAILERASGSFSVPLKTLDAIHLATALRVAEELGDALTFATHDHPLAAAARAYGLKVVGA